ncbi:MAG: indole-3-glycerol phosphate synthase TrpC [Alphaproteobacteria bacterium]|nr:indole-3-glycerol phosphate synthase TrpC [Alphaproteobacteria bacterium]
MTILDTIAIYKRDEVAAAKAAMPLPEVERRARDAAPSRGFTASLLRARAEHRVGLIGEIKKASPSKGLIRADFDPAVLARAYANGGATCLSVLTDRPSFEGAPEYLMAAREAVPLPILRKDFMIDPYQVAEARCWGADAILVILAMVDDRIAASLMAAARAWNIDALVEIHDDAELDRAIALGAEVIGINNRDLHTFSTSLTVSLKLAPRIPKDRLVIAESGLSRQDDIMELAEAGITSFLIGEALMRQNDVAAATARLTSVKLVT